MTEVIGRFEAHDAFSETWLANSYEQDVVARWNKDSQMR